MSSAERKKSLLDSLERSRNNTSIESNEGVGRRKPSEGSDRRNPKRSTSDSFDLLNALSARRRHSSKETSDEINSSLEYNEANNRPDILDSLNRRRRNVDVSRSSESELRKVALSELRRRSTENVDSEDESSSPKKHSKRNNRSGDSDSESEEIRCLIRRSSSQLEAAEALLARHEAAPDVLRPHDYVRTTFDNDLSDLSDLSCRYSQDDDVTTARRLARFRARMCLAVAAFSLLVIIYVHLQWHFIAWACVMCF